MSDTQQKMIVFDNGTSVALPFRARQIRRTGSLVLALLDPEQYLQDDSYNARLRSGAPSLRNLIAFDVDGNPLWEAELPELLDYYYLIEDDLPLRALSYSGNRCEIDERDGRIVSREFLK